MNTGMQDSFNLAWKLALVVRGTCGEQLLDTYSRERNKIGDEVLNTSARLTAVGTLQNPIAQELRNLVGHFALGLSPVQHALANTMTQVSVGYPDSPMNGPALAETGPRPGERVEPVQEQSPIGAGASPRFAILAAPTRETSDLLATFPGILEGQVRPPRTPEGSGSLGPTAMSRSSLPPATAKRFPIIYAASAISYSTMCRPLRGFKGIAAIGDELQEMIAIHVRLVASAIELRLSR
jgi:hypothetical protein